MGEFSFKEDDILPKCVHNYSTTNIEFKGLELVDADLVKKLMDTSFNSWYDP